ncbi:helix-turn-helix domain-containing protein [Nocardia amikacinitolerans]|uniref:helix-turn-helix domain-containing protein n=1 Tax=Nocardia amikacinitolerans TaxID=756689 RepID=UPI0020A34B76|nr:AraC family transcriptional regulator [Nocardia amikacinitolerans]
MDAGDSGEMADGGDTRRWRGIAALSPGRLVIVGRIGTAALHAHHSVQIIVSDANMVLADATGEQVVCRAAVVPPDVAHAVIRGAPHGAVVHLDPESAPGARWAAVARPRESVRGWARAAVELGLDAAAPRLRPEQCSGEPLPAESAAAERSLSEPSAGAGASPQRTGEVSPGESVAGASRLGEVGSDAVRHVAGCWPGEPDGGGRSPGEAGAGEDVSPRGSGEGSSGESVAGASRLGEVGSDAVRHVVGCWPGEPDAGERSPGECGARELSSGEAGTGELSSGEVAAGEPSSGEVGAGDPSSGEARIGEASSGEADAGGLSRVPLTEEAAAFVGWVRAALESGSEAEWLRVGAGEGVRHPAVAEVLRLLPERIAEGPVRLADLARAVHLSESRLAHVFSAELGLPFRPYLRWLRVQRAVELLAAGHTLTEVAHGAGFADSAHLTRVCRAMFGAPPSQFGDLDWRGALR